MKTLDFRYQLSSGLFCREVEVTDLKTNMLDLLSYINRDGVLSDSEIDEVVAELNEKGEYGGKMMELYLL